MFARAQAALRPLADAETAAGMEAYMRGRFAFLGVKTPGRRQATRQLLKEIRTLDRAFVDACFAAPEREFQYLACDHIRRVRLNEGNLPYLNSLVREKSWWDTVDALAKPIGAIAPAGVMKAWATDEDMWVRRVAILHQLGKRADTDTELLTWIIRTNLGSDEFFINKAIGWALREYAKTDPEWVRSFVGSHELAALSIREATKNLD